MVYVHGVTINKLYLKRHTMWSILGFFPSDFIMHDTNCF